jgi:hypothetical protein
MLKKLLKIIALICFAASFSPMITSAQNSLLKIPIEVKPFVEEGMAAIALESADLNGDGTKDFILVTEKSKSHPTDDDTDDSRLMLIIVRDQSGKLTLAVRNEKVVYCRSCGGTFGDPFDGIQANRKSFVVYNYGGSWQRWGDYYQFNYSRRDQTWQLVLVQKINYDSHNPEKVHTKILTPKKFGKIGITDFDPDAIP